jgi:hypothetical protein
MQKKIPCILKEHNGIKLKINGKENYKKTIQTHGYLRIHFE